ncbi:MAG: DUF6268 family outer membrane beta-barrel protein [Planctomycetes bacterium]|nr:DUF6268 family outer membrane beta-barrel protein [Planctomycetota bacterium]
MSPPSIHFRLSPVAVAIIGLLLSPWPVLAQREEPRRLPPVQGMAPSTANEAYSWWLSQPPNPIEPAPGQVPAPAPAGVAPAAYDVPVATPLIDLDADVNEPLSFDAPRDGVFQKIVFNATYMPGRTFSGLGITDLDLSTTFAFPIPSRDHPLVITPGMEAHYFDGPSSPDLPPHVYDAWLKIRTLGKINECWGYDVAVSPGWHSDFDNNSGEAFRITGYGFGAYTYSDTLQLVLGVIYLNRPNLRMIPAAGLIWTPDEDTRFELTAPRPTIARRWYADDCTEHWFYIAGELGGGTWAIEQNGVNDLMTYNDYRILIGWERKTIRGFTALAEFGYVFARQVSFDSGAPDYDPNDTMMVRMGAKY